MIAAIVLVTVVLIFVISKVIGLKKSSDSVPGPSGLPFVGYYPLLFSDITEILDKLTRRYGKIFKISFLGHQFYYINDLELLKEAFITKGKFTAGRPGAASVASDPILPKPMADVEGAYWKIHRKFFMRKISDLGAGKSDLEVKIIDLCNKLVSDIHNSKGKDCDFYESFTNFHFNVITTLFFSQQFSYNDPIYVQIRDDAREFLNDVSFALDMLLSGPLLRLLSLFKETSPQKGRRIWERSRSYFLQLVEQRLKTYQRGDANDMLDLYIEKYLQEKETSSDSAPVFNKTAIADLLFEMFIAGVGTMTSTLHHGIYHMIQHPEVQDQVQKEIDRNLGLNAQVSLGEQSLLNYCNAVINEVQRLACVIPLGLAHSATDDICVGGYRIPKGAIITANLRYIASSERYFKNANAFDPSNFLDQDNNFVRSEANLPFSTGTRICAGFSLAQATLFLVFVTLLQKFRWTKAESGTSQARVDKGMPRTLTPYYARATLRI